jgi:hypothetical protein
MKEVWSMLVNEVQLGEIYSLLSCGPVGSGVGYLFECNIADMSEKNVNT